LLMYAETCSTALRASGATLSNSKRGCMMFSPSERKKHSGYGLRVIGDLSIVDIWMDDAVAGEIRKNVTKEEVSRATGVSLP
jgi:hypothetical protein